MQLLTIDLWVTLDDFTVKEAKLGREICIQLKIGLVETKCVARQVITIIWIPYVRKDF